MTKSKQSEQTTVTTENLAYDPIVLAGCASMSARIRYLDACGLKRGQISKILSDFAGKLVRYQWVRNVLITPVKKS